MKRIIRHLPLYGTIFLMIVLTLKLAACNSSSDKEEIEESKQTIHFFTGTLKEAGALSKKENKPIFLFAHANYCGSCKRMRKEVFSLEEVGDVFNKSFINIQVDVESEEGAKVVKEYEVTGTPTLLFLTPDGKVISKSNGYKSHEELLTLIKGLIF